MTDHRLTDMCRASAEQGLSAQEAAQALLSVPLRSFAEELSAYLPAQAMREQLVERLMQTDSTLNRDSVSRKVRGWLSGEYRPSDRSELWKLCFALRLDIPSADAFLARVGEYGIHWRDPREMARAYALREGMTYAGAQALLTRIIPDAPPSPDTPDTFTPIARKDFADIRTEGDLRDYIIRQSGKLGALHNTAWQFFASYMEALENPNGLFIDAQKEQDGAFSSMRDKRMSVREVLEKYFEKKLFVDDRGKSRYTRTQKQAMPDAMQAVMGSWPDEFEISRMKNRVIDVPRKTIILLFLVTDGIGSDSLYDADEFDDDELDYESAYVRLNNALDQCGFSPLDPRSPFDWLMIYCLHETDSEDVITAGAQARMSKVLRLLFASSDSAAD